MRATTARRVALPALFLSALGCAPAVGSSDWVVRKYSEALLQSDAAQMRAHLARGGVPSALPRDPRENEPHVVRICPYGEDGDARREVLVLVSSGLERTARGIGVTLVKEEDAWKIREARLTRDKTGAPSRYFWDCSVRLDKPERRDPLYSNLPTPARAQREEPPAPSAGVAQSPIVQPQPKTPIVQPQPKSTH